MDIHNFRHIVSLTPRFGDMDAMGHVNNAKYHTYLEEARLTYAQDVLGWSSTDKVGMILARTELDYLLPLRMGHTVNIYTRCTRLGRKSFDMECVMVLASDERLVIDARTTMVAYNYERRRSMHIPPEWRERILEYEQIKPVIA